MAGRDQADRLVRRAHRRSMVGIGEGRDLSSGDGFLYRDARHRANGRSRADRFYSYFPAMAREPDGVTCWGRYGDGTETYTPPLTLSARVWHRIEFWVRLNTPG